jgi:hypothetical protein
MNPGAAASRRPRLWLALCLSRATWIGLLSVLSRPLVVFRGKAKCTMRIFDALLGSTPKWARQLPAWLRPPASQIRRIEAIRRRFGIPHSDLFAFIAGHAVSSKRTIESHYRQLQQRNPSATEEDVLTALLWSRVLSGLAWISTDHESPNRARPFDAYTE